MPLDSELIGYICFFTVTEYMTVFPLAWIKCSQTVRWAFLMWSVRLCFPVRSLPDQDVPSPEGKKATKSGFGITQPRIS